MQVCRTLTVILYDQNPLHLQKVQGNADCVMMKVSREYCANNSLSRLGEFKEPCLYFLVDDFNRIYIGQARQFSERVKDHLSKKDWWTKAYVFVSDAGRYDTACVEYLEYLAVREAQELQRYDCSENKQTPSNPTLRSYERPKMEKDFQEIKFFLTYERCFAFEKPESPQEAEDTKTIFSMIYKGCLSQGYIEDWNSRRFCLMKGAEISPTTTLSFTKHRQRDELLRHCTKGKGGIFILNGDYSFSSPSMAASCCSGHSQNGLAIWKDADAVPLKQYIENKQ